MLFASGCSTLPQPLKPTYKVSLREAHKGTLNIDSLLLDSFGPPCKNKRTFYLKAREILESSPPTTPSNPKIVEAAKKSGLSLMSGPMLGNLSTNSITIWLRPVDTGEMVVKVKAKKGAKKVPFKATTPGAVIRIEIKDLEPYTQYEYEIINEKGSVLGKGAFRTAPEPNSGQTFRLAFGSCFHKIGVHNPNLMRLILERGNLATLLLGDLAVDDRETKLNMHYSDYLLRDVSKSWRDFSANMHVYTSWDDHDYLNNDKSGLQKGQITDNERNAMRQLWVENWNNPQTPVKDRGIYFNTVIGDVEIIMLDTRSCRNWKQRKKRGAYLGDEQMKWLFANLKTSKSKFIIITSGTMWSDYMSRAKDSWGTWDIPGREEIFKFIEDNHIGGVLLLSGDRHGARGFKIKCSSGFVLHEFEAATLGGVPGPVAFAKDRSMQLFGYRGGLKAFGEFTFNMKDADPEVVFRLINEQGKVLEKHNFRRSQLSPDKVEK